MNAGIVGFIVVVILFVVIGGLPAVSTIVIARKLFTAKA